METQKQQQYQYQYQYQQRLNSISQSYDPSQVQSHDQSTQAYYAAYHHYTQAHANEYSYYYPAGDYSNSYQYHQPQNDANSVHPPGVPIRQQTQLQNHQNSAHPAFSGAGSQGSKPLRRGRWVSFGDRGRGQGSGRGRHGPSHTASYSAPPQPTASSSVKPPPHMAWCELCRVDCTTPEILGQHKNGKKHKKNLKVQDELQNLNKVLMGMQNQQMSVSGPRLEVTEPEKLEGPENATSVVATEVNKSENLPERDSTGKSDTSGARGGFKRRGIRGGRGGKWMRTPEGSKRFAEPHQPKQVVPLICELCNVKCESKAVFDSHLAGKKHLSNVKRFQGHVAAFGGGVQLLFPTIPNAPPALLQQVNQGLHDTQAFASATPSQQSLNDSEACRAALTQLLNQHGIQDPETLLAQLIPLLLAEVQGHGLAPGPSELSTTGALGVQMSGPSAAPASEASGAITPLPLAGQQLDVQHQQNSQGEDALLSTGAENQNALSVETDSEQQDVTTNSRAQLMGGTSHKLGDDIDSLVLQSSSNFVDAQTENNNAVRSEDVLPMTVREQLLVSGLNNSTKEDIDVENVEAEEKEPTELDFTSKDAINKEDPEDEGRH
ncbi:hypothetical protein Ancab_037185 [Ancistrocladus abbreviatus]